MIDTIVVIFMSCILIYVGLAKNSFFLDIGIKNNVKRKFILLLGFIIFFFSLFDLIQLI